MTRTTMLFQAFFQVWAASLLAAKSVLPMRPLVLWHGLGYPYTRIRLSRYMLTLNAQVTHIPLQECSNS